MNPFILLASIGLVLLVLVVMFSRLGRKEDGSSNHYILQIIIFGFIIFFLLLIGKVAVDNNEACSWNIANTSVVNNVTSYNYNYDCVTNTSRTTSIFYNYLLWFSRIVILYLALYFIYEVLVWFNIMKKKKERGEE